MKKSVFTRRILRAAALLCSALFLSCVTVRESRAIASFEEAGALAWSPLAPGFWTSEFSVRGRGADCYAVRIDLGTAGLELAARPGETSRPFRLDDFALEEGAVVAINTTPFSIEGASYIPDGITKLNGVQTSSPNSRYAALCFYNDGESGALRAAIIDTQDEAALAEYPSAFGGFFVTMRNGELREFEGNTRSRQGVGLGEGGRVLYILTVISRGSLTDENGLTYWECSRLLSAMGAVDAMQFDGGHSAGLCLSLGGRLVTQAAPFMQRKIPAALGFRINLD